MKNQWVILERPGGWELFRLEAANAAVFVELTKDQDEAGTSGLYAARQISGLIREHGYSGQPVLVALATSSCYSSGFAVDQSADGKKRDFLRYEFERAVPFSAEEVVADFQVQGDVVFGVGVSVKQHINFIDGLRANDISIGCICAQSLLTAQGLVKLSPFTSTPFWLLLKNQDALEALLMKRQGLQGWLRLPRNPLVAAQTLEMAFAKEASGDNCSSCIWAVGEAQDSFSEIQQHLSVAVELDNSNRAVDAATVMPTISQDVLDGRTAPWFEFNRDAFSTGDQFANIRGAINFAIVSVTLGLVLIIASLGWRTNQLVHLRAQHLKLQDAAYAQLHPGSAIPKGIQRRLLIEKRELQKRQELVRATVVANSPMVSLKAFLSSLAGSHQIQVNSLQLSSDGAVEFDAELDNRRDAERLKTGLARAGFEILAFPTRYRNQKVAVSGKMSFSQRGVGQESVGKP